MPRHDERWQTGDMSLRGRRALAAAILGRHFRFLWSFYEKEAIETAENFTSQWKGRDAKEFSNALQRELYKLARSKGFKKLRGGRWTNVRASYRGVVMAALRRGRLGWLPHVLAREDFEQEMELCLLEIARMGFTQLIYRAAYRHFYQVAVNYGYKRLRGSGSFVKHELLISDRQFGEEEYGEAEGRLANTETKSPWEQGPRRRNRYPLPRKNRAFWQRVRARVSEEDWDLLWDWATRRTLSMPRGLLKDVRRRVLA